MKYSVVGGLAISLPQLDNFISLLGAVSSSALAIIFPPILHMLTFKGHGLTCLGVCKDIFIISIGVLGFLFGTYTSLLAIIYGFEHPGPIEMHKATVTNGTTFSNTTSSLYTCKYPY